MASDRSFSASINTICTLVTCVPLITLTVKRDYLTAVSSASGEHEKQKEEYCINFSRKLEINFDSRGMTNFFILESVLKTIRNSVVLVR
jgi:hypothetical protein